MQQHKTLLSFPSRVGLSADMDRATNRLHRTEKRKARPSDRPPLVDIPLAITEEELSYSLGPRAGMKLQRAGHTIVGVGIETVLFDDFPKAQEGVTRPAISRSAQGVTAGGLITCEEVLSENRADEERKEEESATVRAVNQAAKDAAATARALQGTDGGRGRGVGRGKERGRGGSGVGGRGEGRGLGFSPAAEPSSME